MTTDISLRYLTSLLAAAILSLSASMVAAQTPISIDPKTVQTGTSPTITVSSSGFFDLSKVTASQVSVNPGAGISNIRVSNGTPRSMSVSLDVSAKAASGERMLSISADDVIVSVKLSVTGRRDPNVCRPPCRFPNRCEDGACVPPPPHCNPRCVPPKICVQNNVCELKQ